MEPDMSGNLETSGAMEPDTSGNLQTSGTVERDTSGNLQPSGVMESVMSNNLQTSGVVESVTSENIQTSGAPEPPPSENLHSSGVMEPAMSENLAENLPNSTSPENMEDQNHDRLDSDVLDNGGMEIQDEFEEDDIRSILEVIAATGKFWHDWDKLKRMISFYLKQVLSEYPEAKLTNEQQSSSLGETFPELEKRLDDALNSFIEGPPFTLQRLCEILLGARAIYPVLSKLVLALDKNLLVTSMLAKCNDPYPPPSVAKQHAAERGIHPQTKAKSEENGVKPTTGEGDEIMAEGEEADNNDDMTIDMETFGEIVGSSGTTNPVPASEP